MISPVRFILGVPLVAKLAGANVLVVLVGTAIIYKLGLDVHGASVLLVAVGALTGALVINVALVALALKPIRELERTAWQAWSGNIETRVPASRITDVRLDRVSKTLNGLLEELAQDRTRARLLASAVIKASDRERARVGHELHDSIGQSVAALRFQLLAAQRDCQDSALAERLGALRDVAGDLLEEVKLLSLNTHPRMLDDLGLAPALRHLARSLQVEAAVHVTVSPEAEVALASLPREVSSVLYGVAREAIDNALRHAAPNTIVLALAVAGGTIEMQVDDDGTGFEIDTLDVMQPTAGLFVMRERTVLANGVFEIVSASKGTSVRVRIPTG